MDIRWFANFHSIESSSVFDPLSPCKDFITYDQMVSVDGEYLPVPTACVKITVKDGVPRTEQGTFYTRDFCRDNLFRRTK